MSRSYKKPYGSQPGGSYKRYAKNQANRCVRRAVDVVDGNNYKRYYDSWDIVDYRWHMPEKTGKWWKFYRK